MERTFTNIMKNVLIALTSDIGLVILEVNFDEKELEEAVVEMLQMLIFRMPLGACSDMAGGL